MKIEEIQVGFGMTPPVAEFKNGFWTPVFVYVKAFEGGSGAGGKVTVESADGDDVRGRYTVTFPQLNPEEVFMVQSYAKPGRSEFTVTLELNGKIVSSEQRDFHAMDFAEMLFLTVGSRLPSLKPALNPKQPNQQGEDDDTAYVHQGYCRVAGVDDVRMLPKVWFAYEPVDLLILTTGKREGFVTALLNEREGRKEALAEWVRRGGRLLVSVGRNQDMLRDREFEILANLLPVAVTDKLQVPHLHPVEQMVGPEMAFPAPRGGTFEIAKLEPKPGRSIETMLYWNPEKKETPLIARGAYGLGSVTVIAFDLDEPPFKGWKGQKPFLQSVVHRITPAASQAIDHNPAMGSGNRPQVSDVGGKLETALEQFDEIPVISFGWVALFILIYILVVGPLDYFFLKKVVKRLELTWITFPTVVITISVAAYFTAYWLKGNDQKINKVDVVDIDLSTQQVYGNSWFTIFSPRIQHYTVGLEPVENEWVPTPPAGKPVWPVEVSWMGRQESAYGGGRGQSQGLFRRAYDYAENATGMAGVPIQVWSTKSFASSWQASFDPDKPLVSADLRLRDRTKPYSGTITSRLPVPLEDVYIRWSGAGSAAWFSLGTLVPNTPKRVDGVFNNGHSDIDGWGITPVQAPGTPQGKMSGSVGNVVRQLMFFGAPQNTERNLTLQELDQHWRLQHEDEVFVIGRIPRMEGPAEDISLRKESPSRIWLGTLPGGGSQRLPLNGTLSQETFVRIIIPVKTAAK